MSDKAMTRKFGFVIENKLKLEVTEDMIEQVFREFEADHPGQTFNAMSEREFGDRMMAKIIESVEWVQ